MSTEAFTICNMCMHEIEEVNENRSNLDRTDGTNDVRNEYPLDHYPRDFAVCKECARQYIVEKKAKIYKPIIGKLSSMANRSEFTEYDIEALVNVFCQEHRYLQNEMIIFLRNILAKLGEMSGDVMWEDARNAWGLAWAKRAGDVE